jgi:hypothetical protein
MASFKIGRSSIYPGITLFMILRDHVLREPVVGTLILSCVEAVHLRCESSLAPLASEMMQGVATLVFFCCWIVLWWRSMPPFLDDLVLLIFFL